jgi:hypothetical protein
MGTSMTALARRPKQMKNVDDGARAPAETDEERR